MEEKNKGRSKGKKPTRLKRASSTQNKKERKQENKKTRNKRKKEKHTDKKTKEKTKEKVTTGDQLPWDNRGVGGQLLLLTEGRSAPAPALDRGRPFVAVPAATLAGGDPRPRREQVRALAPLHGLRQGPEVVDGRERPFLALQRALGVEHLNSISKSID